MRRRARRGARAETQCRGFAARPHLHVEIVCAARRIRGEAARRGAAWRSVAQRGAARRSVAQRSAAAGSLRLRTEIVCFVID